MAHFIDFYDTSLIFQNKRTVHKHTEFQPKHLSHDSINNLFLLFQIMLGFRLIGIIPYNENISIRIFPRSIMHCLHSNEATH